MLDRTAAGIADFLKLAQSRYKTVFDLETDQRTKEAADLLFESGEHWDETLLEERKLRRRPTATYNTLSAMIRQGANRQRVAGPGIQVRPASKAASKEKAKTYREVMRQIERNSKAHLAYDNARQHQRKAGRGFWVVRNRYADDDSMDQVLRIEWIDNLHSVFLDPHFKRQDYSDRLWGMIVDAYSLDDFKAAFPHATHYDLSSFAEESPSSWMQANKVVVAEYFWIKQDVELRIMLDNGMMLAGDDLNMQKVRRGRKSEMQPTIPEGRYEVRRRNVPRPKVYRSLVTAKEIFEENEIPFQSVPIVQIDGERRNLPGRGVDLRGQVRDAKEAARSLDFMESGILEAIVTARTAPWLVEVQQIAGALEDEWIDQAVNNPAVLRYKAQGSAENPIPPPQRNLAAPDISAFVAAAARAENHQRQTLGEPDVFQEEKKREQSGRAINARRRLQEIGTSHFAMNEGAGHVRTAELLMDAIPVVYDRPRVMRLVDDRGAMDRQVVMYSGAERQDEANQMAGLAGPSADGKPMELFDPSDDRYEVTYTSGVNAMTDQIEAFETINDAIRQYPQLAPVALPILFRNSDWSGSEELVEAMTKMQPIPPEVEQRLKGLDEYASRVTELYEQLGKENEKLQRKLEDKNLDRDAKVGIAQLQAETQRFREAASNATTLAVEEMKNIAGAVQGNYERLEARFEALLKAVQPAPAPAT